MLPEDLPQLLAERLAQPLPGQRAQSRLAPDLSYGRQYGPAALDARPAAVAVLLFPRDGRWWLPLTLRPEHLLDHAGQISLPGGTVEGDEGHLAAALRELEEELGVPRDAPQMLGSLTPLYLFVSNFLVLPWLAWLPEAPRLVPNPAEVSAVLELPLDVLLDAGHYGRHWITRRAVRFAAPHIRWQTHQIWGVTGMILAELAALLGAVRRDGPAAADRVA